MRERHRVEIAIDPREVEQEIAEIVEVRRILEREVGTQRRIIRGRRRESRKEVARMREHRIGSKPRRPQELREQAARELEHPSLRNEIELVDRKLTLDHVRE